jgi:hypothetical protein
MEVGNTANEEAALSTSEEEDHNDNNHSQTDDVRSTGYRHHFMKLAALFGIPTGLWEVFEALVDAADASYVNCIEMIRLRMGGSNPGIDAVFGHYFNWEFFSISCIIPYRGCVHSLAMCRARSFHI